MRLAGDDCSPLRTIHMIIQIDPQIGLIDSPQ